MAKKKKPRKRRVHLGISWQTMKVGVVAYEGTYDGAKANACRANKLYKPKTWRTFSNADGVFIERLT